GEDGRHHRQVERHLREREESQHQDRIMKHGEDRTDRKSPGVKAESDVQEYPEQREEQRPHGAHPQLVPDLWTDHIELRHLHAGIDGTQRSLESRAPLAWILLRIGRQADVEVARGAEALYLRLAETGSSELGTHRVDVGGMREADLGTDTAGEV